MQNDNHSNSGELARNTILPQVYGEPPMRSELWKYPIDLDVGTIGIAVTQTIALRYRNDSWTWVDRSKPWLGFCLIDGKWNEREELETLRELIIVAKDIPENRAALKKSIRLKRGDSPSTVHLALYAMVKNPKFKKKGKLIELNPEEEDSPQGTEDKSARIA